VLGGQPRWQLRELSAQNSFGGMSTLDAHFGLADAAEADSVVVQWPSGIVQVLTHVPLRGRINIDEGSSTPVVGALVQASASAGAAQLEWQFPGVFGLVVRIQRAAADTDWIDVAQAVVDESHRVRFTDTAVQPGVRYGYRLILNVEGMPHAAGETWLQIPLHARFGFDSVGPNPGRGAVQIEFDLRAGAPGELEFFNAAGRRVARILVPATAGGHQVIRTGSELGAGVFFVRLRQGARSDRARFTLVR